MGVDPGKTGPNSVHVDLLLGELKEVLRLEPKNVNALCRIGGKLARLGRTKDVQKCYRAAVDALLRSSRAGNVEAALTGEKQIYEAFVMLEETEESYYRRFSDWRDRQARLVHPACQHVQAAADFDYDPRPDPAQHFQDETLPRGNHHLFEAVILHVTRCILRDAFVLFHGS